MEAPRGVLREAGRSILVAALLLACLGGGFVLFLYNLPKFEVMHRSLHPLDAATAYLKLSRESGHIPAHTSRKRRRRSEDTTAKHLICGPQEEDKAVFRKFPPGSVSDLKLQRDVLLAYGRTYPVRYPHTPALE